MIVKIYYCKLQLCLCTQVDVTLFTSNVIINTICFSKPVNAIYQPKPGLRLMIFDSRTILSMVLYCNAYLKICG